MYLQCSHGFWGQYFSGWCFTHQYKNTTQFYFYAALLSSQNTKAKNMQRSYLGNLGNVASGSVTLPGLSRCKWLIIVPYGGQPSAPAIIVGGGIRFSGVATDANIASIYEVGFRITGDSLTFSFNKAYLVPGGTEFQMTFGDVYGIIE